MYKHEFQFTNGTSVRDKITGFKGVITGACFYLTGCNQYLVMPESVDNKKPEGSWYDEGRLEEIEAATRVKAEVVAAKARGCDMVAPGGSREH